MMNNSGRILYARLSPFVDKEAVDDKPKETKGLMTKKYAQGGLATTQEEKPVAIKVIDYMRSVRNSMKVQKEENTDGIQ
tara:strand:- start:107 stop:343 length:237 start_codon:yes stop_codon:yes gene_type:complete